MRLLREQLRRQLPELERNNVQLRAIGQLDRLPLTVRWELRRAIRKLSHNTGLILNLALSYGGRQEILQAVRRIAQEVQSGKLQPEEIDERRFSSYLYTGPLPEPDLIIRTSGEQRLSNFLLWQCAYAEFYFTPVLWPDFRRRHLYEAILAYQGRERRFGGVGGPVP
ncbi:MAG: hypothetical protein KatS3mg115_1838 [Candidatus Poribacteria bacterium]|nr:MAG: hypothetical protein KatS3mg115_1838 [Candidatus Poribacteria bacterium]